MAVVEEAILAVTREILAHEVLVVALKILVKKEAVLVVTKEILIAEADLMAEGGFNRGGNRGAEN